MAQMVWLPNFLGPLIIPGGSPQPYRIPDISPSNKELYISEMHVAMRGRYSFYYNKEDLNEFLEQHPGMAERRGHFDYTKMVIVLGC
jgi:hypothetical protein